MPAPSNLLTVVAQIPTTGPQRYVDAAGAAISLVVTDEDPEPIESLDPEEMLLAQGVSGPVVLTNPDGSAVNLDATVVSPYSLVTPPGAIVVG